MKKLIFTLLFLLVAFNLQAKTVTVATTGNNTNSCTAGAGSPKLTLMGATGGISCLVAGDILDIRTGNYDETITSAGTPTLPNGTSGSPITIQGHVGEVVRITTIDFALGAGRQYIVFDNLLIDNSVGGGISGISINSGNDHITLKNSTIQNSWNAGIQGDGTFNTFQNVIVRNSGLEGVPATKGYGIYWRGADTVFEHMQVYDNPGYGFHIFDSGSSVVSRNTVQFSKIHDNCGSEESQGQILISNGDDNRVIGNLIYNTGAVDCAHGIQTGGSTSTNYKIYNNTIHNAGVLHGIRLGTASTGGIVRNNLLVANGIAGIDSADATAPTLSNNVTTGTAQSHFADAANADFRLCSEAGIPSANCTGTSTAVGAGFDLSGTFTVDIVGSVWVVPWDAGAYKAVSQAPVPPTPALVLQISCDNVVTDSSGNANHGTLTNGATYNATGKYGAACFFDGINDHVLVADSTSLDLTHGFTLSAWVKPAGAITTDNYVISKSGSGVNGFYWLAATGNPACVTAGGYFQTSDVYACHGSPLTTDWVHMTATYDNQGVPNIRLYLNAIEVTNAIGSAVLSANAGSLYIGSTNGAGYFAGLLDEIRIYNYARSPAQIADDMNQPINEIAAPSNLTIGASATGMKWGAGATALRIVGSLTAVPVVQVAYDATSESHTGTTGNTSSASFQWTHTPVGAPAGVIVFTFNANSNASDATSVTYGGDSLTQVVGGLASDTATEPGSCEAWFVGTSVPTGAQTVLVNRTNNANIMYAVAITVTASTDVAVIGTPVLQQNNGTLTQSSIDTSAVIAQRFACAYHGGNAIPVAGANSTMLHSIDFGVFTAGVARETTPGSGNRPAGMTSVSDDRAQVVLAIGIP